MTSADQCAYGLVTKGPDVYAFAQKPTKFMTNSPCIAEELRRSCPNRQPHGRRTHGHIPLMNGRTKVAQEYPNALCRAICRGIVKQTGADREGRFLLATLHDMTSQGDINKVLMQIKDELESITEGERPESVSAWVGSNVLVFLSCILGCFIRFAFCVRCCSRRSYGLCAVLMSCLLTGMPPTIGKMTL